MLGSSDSRLLRSSFLLRRLDSSRTTENMAAPHSIQALQDLLPCSIAFLSDCRKRQSLDRSQSGFERSLPLPTSPLLCSASLLALHARISLVTKF